MWVAILFIVPHRKLRKTIFLIFSWSKAFIILGCKRCVCVCVDEGEHYIGVSYSSNNTLSLTLILLIGIYLIFLNKYFFMCVFPFKYLVFIIFTS